MNKKELQAKIARTSAPAAANTTTFSETMTMEQLQWWLGFDTNKNNLKSKIIDLSDIFKEKIQFLLFGKPLIIEREEEDAEEGKEPDEDAAKAVKKFINAMNLQETLFANEGNVFLHGRGYIIIDVKNNGKATLRLAAPNFPNTVTRMGQTPVSADVYTPFFFSKVKYYMRTTYTQDKITNKMFKVVGSGTNPGVNDLKEVGIKKFNRKNGIPDNLKIVDEMKNPYGFIPVVEVTYKPVVDFSWANKSKLAPMHKVTGIQKMLNEGTEALRTELLLNRTKILIDQDMLDTQDKQALEVIAKAGILGILKDTGGIDGDGKQIEVLQGNPMVENYWENIKNIISIAAQSLKLSELGQEGADSATGEIFSKGNDVETANTLQIFRQKSIAELLTKAWAMENNEVFYEDELNTSAWSVQLIPNVIMNEAKMTEIVTQQLSAGIINMTQAVVKLEGISQSDARSRLSQDDGIYNPSLEAVSSFTDDGENADDGKGETTAQKAGNSVKDGK